MRERLSENEREKNSDNKIEENGRLRVWDIERDKELLGEAVIKI